ncbi:MAG: DUF3558 family protein [Chloroflexota bacterium]
MRTRLASLATVLLLAACGPSSPGSSNGGEPSSGGAPSQAPASDAAPDPTLGTSLTACELVTPADVEAALALDPGTVADGDHRETPTVLSPGSNECRYEGDAWGGLLVTVTPEDGVNTFDAVNSAFGDDAEVVRAGDTALWFPDNLRGYFLQGSVMVLLQFTFVVNGADFKEATISAGRSALARL